MSIQEKEIKTVTSEVKKYLQSGFEKFNDQIAIEIPVLIKFNSRSAHRPTATPASLMIDSRRVKAQIESERALATQA